MILVSRKDCLTFKFFTGFLTWLYILQVVLVARCQGFTKQNNIKGFGFQKEHDGSIFGMEDGIQQIAITGIPVHLGILKLFFDKIIIVT